MIHRTHNSNLQPKSQRKQRALLKTRNTKEIRKKDLEIILVRQKNEELMKLLQNAYSANQYLFNTVQLVQEKCKNLQHEVETQKEINTQSSKIIHSLKKSFLTTALKYY